jgi:hypothetical protein
MGKNSLCSLIVLACENSETADVYFIASAYLLSAL